MRRALLRLTFRRPPREGGIQKARYLSAPLARVRVREGPRKGPAERLLARDRPRPLPGWDSSPLAGTWGGSNLARGGKKDKRNDKGRANKERALRGAVGNLRGLPARARIRGALVFHGEACCTYAPRAGSSRRRAAARTARSNATPGGFPRKPPSPRGPATRRALPKQRPKC